MDTSKHEFSALGVIVCLLFAVAVCVAGLLPVACANVAHAASFESEGKAAYLMDSATGTVIYARREKERLPIASMVKIMTALLTFEAVERGDVGFDDMVAVSGNAASMGGSQVFLDAGSEHKLDELLKSVIVASANDSCVALAEHIDGSIGAFVNRMNSRAAELGMKNTNFKNCTGLPAAESFSCAEDVAKMFSELIKHPRYFEYAAIWTEDFKHPSGRVTTITNTNKLVRFYKGCDGGKTGFTNEAMFCLAATAKRADTRVIAVLMGASSAKSRNAAISAMFDNAFDNYENRVFVKAGEQLEKSVEVSGGKSDTAYACAKDDLTAFMARSDKAKYEVRYDLPSLIGAPVRAGQSLGKIYLVREGEVIAETEALSLSDVKRMSLFDAIGEIGKHWATR